uniref:Domain of unknown function DB domain-containing protein n=1 Tax=Plectus sambesii TaxID=2011161 RepID=A0A914X572_9BILA
MNGTVTLLFLLVNLTILYGQDIRVVGSHLASLDDNSETGLPTVAEMEAACPHEALVNNNFKCAERAERGLCSGKTTSAKVIRTRLCPCTCTKYLTDRIQTCCKAVGATPKCMSLCRYNTTKEEILAPTGYQCGVDLPRWSYCGWDTTDGRSCCRNNGVPEECLTFCKSELPCDLFSGDVAGRLHCINFYPKMLECQLRSIPSKPQWDPNWKAQPTC